MQLEALAQKLGEALNTHALMLCTAESCTAGGLSYWITSIPGSSQWFDRGFVCYSNEAKIEMLGVNPLTLEKDGAVSEATAREMAKGALAKSNTDISIAITGIAGPNGGTADKPAGYIWFAYCNKRTGEAIAEAKQFQGNRQSVREQCIEHALSTLLKLI